MIYNASLIIKYFKKLGLKKGDIIFLHADSFFLNVIFGNNLEQKVNNFIDCIIEVIGKEGTLIIPTFTYSSTKNEVFNVSTSCSQVGSISEFFRKRPDTNRTKHPIFSVSYVGSLSEEISKTSNYDCFGEDSIFQILYKYNAWIFTIGCSFDRITFVHFLEQSKRVNYRYFKSFKSIVIDNNKTTIYETRYFVRDTNTTYEICLDALKKKLISNLKLIESEIGRAHLYGVKAIDFYKTGEYMLQSNQFALVIKKNKIENEI